MDCRHGFPADVEETKVEEMLAICSDESLLKLSLNTHSISASSDSLLLNSDLLARLHRLKTPPPPILHASQPPPPLADPHDIDILGAHLASRLAALKQPSSPPSGHPESTAPPPPIEKRPPSANRSPAVSSPDFPSRSNQEMNFGALSVSSSDGPEVEKLLASVSDQVRLEKASAMQKARVSDDDAADGTKDSEEEISDSDVVEMVEWAKDAARLDICDDDEGTADPAMVEEAQDESTPSPRSRLKKTSIGWSKFW